MDFKSRVQYEFVPDLSKLGAKTAGIEHAIFEDGLGIAYFYDLNPLKLW